MSMSIDDYKEAMFHAGKEFMDDCVRSSYYSHFDIVYQDLRFYVTGADVGSRGHGRSQAISDISDAMWDQGFIDWFCSTASGDEFCLMIRKGPENVDVNICVYAMEQVRDKLEAYWNQISE